MDDIKLAMLGNREAAKRLTDAGVLVPCPFCGNDAVVHEVEAQPKYAETQKEVPKGQTIRRISYPSGKEYFEYREKEYIPQCVVYFAAQRFAPAGNFSLEHPRIDSECGRIYEIGGNIMSLYNMINGFNPACLLIMPMLGRKQEEWPSFDCL